MSAFFTGKEFTHTLRLTETLSLQTYFAPRRNWAAIKSSSMLQKYMPNKEVLSTVAQETTMIQRGINHRPDEPLGFSPPLLSI